MVENIQVKLKKNCSASQFFVLRFFFFLLACFPLSYCFVSYCFVSASALLNWIQKYLLFYHFATSKYSIRLNNIAWPEATIGLMSPFHRSNVLKRSLVYLVLRPHPVWRWTSEIWVSHLNKGGKCLKKLWCCVGGSITREFGFINWVDNVS